MILTGPFQLNHSTHKEGLEITEIILTSKYSEKWKCGVVWVFFLGLQMVAMNTTPG